MSEVLARIRVRETSGIRRFLYPLTAYVSTADIDPIDSRIVAPDGSSVPMQVTQWGKEQYRVDFAISLDPFSEQDFLLTDDRSDAVIDDPLDTEIAMEKGLLWSKQKRFIMLVQHDALHRDVVYDNVVFPKDLPTITCNGRPMSVAGTKHTPVILAKLSAYVEAEGRYPDGGAAKTHTDITAVKSWEMITHTLEQPQPDDEIIFNLPLAITSPTLTCDFGVGGYVFGKLDANAPEIVWHTEFGDVPYAKWTVATAGRVDYVGEVGTAEAFLPQRWFHLIDSDKALAVAVTQLPEGCQSMTVRLTHAGDVSIAFKLGGKAETVAAFGVCYHFLNDVPAIAAATNPQSILLPPMVEVMPRDLEGWRE